MNTGARYQPAAQPYSDGGATGPNQPAAKVYVLYVQPNDPASAQAVQEVQDYPEILVQNVAAMPRAQIPPWLTGTPTAYSVNTQNLYCGERALQLMHSYHLEAQAAGGAQSTNVLEDNSNRTVAGGYNQPFQNPNALGIAVGQTTGATNEAGDAGVQQEASTAARYAQSGKVDENDVASYLQRRQQTPQAPANPQLRPSVLGTGEYTTM